MTRLAVTGATGAMGREVRRSATEREGVTPALLVSQSGSIDDVSTPVVHPDELATGLETQNIDVLVDFTLPSGSVELVTTAATVGVPAVVGTTGFDTTQRERLESLAEDIPILVAPNFSRGIQTLLAALDETVGKLDGYDIELTETHHNRKRDAPSGTANRLLETIEAHRPETKRVFSRAGDSPRSRDEIGIHVRRAGNITGEHEVIFAGFDEVVTLTHRAESRAVFAVGALDAAEWLSGQSPGWYTFAEVVDT